MNFFDKKTKIILVIVLMALGGWLIYRGLNQKGDDAILGEPSVKTAIEWLEAADSGDRTAMIKMVSTIVNPEQTVDIFLADTKSLGSSKGRDLRQRTIRTGNGIGFYHEIDFTEHINSPKNNINLKIYVVGSDKKTFKVAGARYGISLPQPTKGGQERKADYEPGTPEAAAKTWFGHWDGGDLSYCSRFGLVRRAFQEGAIADWKEFGPAVPNVRDRLHKMVPPKKLTQRTLSSIQLWQGWPGASQLDLAAVCYNADYSGMRRQEWIWLMKDPNTGSDRWIPYAIRLGDDDKNKKPAPPKK